MNQLLEFWSQLLLKPREFFTTQIKDNTIPYFSLAMFIFCLGYGIDRVDTQLIKADVQNNQDFFYNINNWPYFWLVSVLAGAIGGYLNYLILGWFYNVRVKWSLGKADLKKSRLIYLFSSFYLYLIVILTTCVETIIYPIPYDPYSEGTAFDNYSLIALLFFSFYCIYISYSGARSAMEVNKTRGLIWFLILPIIFYLVVFAAVIYLLMQHYFL